MQDLNRNELEALRILWEGGRLKPGQIQKQFVWPIENATLRSVLRVLVEGGLVAREKIGKAFVYQARASRRGLLTGMVRRLSQVFAGGSPAALVAQLMEIEKLSPDDVAELRAAAQGPNGKTTSRRNGGRKS
jgi:predicted transcriptional regulator